MKWIIILLLIGAGVWTYFNVDFASLGDKAQTSIKQEKTMQKFYNTTNKKQEEVDKVLQEF